MDREEIIKKAAEYLWMNLDMPEEDKEWWIRDFVEYMQM
jgi:hypothetical protein